MKIIVTGASGRFGTVLCKTLADTGHEVTGLDRNAPETQVVTMRYENLCDPTSCMRALEGADAVVHLANHPNQHSGTFHQVYSENCAMNAAVMHAAASHRVARFVFASSIQVFSGDRTMATPGPSRLPYLPLDSRVPANPQNPYALSKVAGEAMLRYFVEEGKFESGFAIRFPCLIRAYAHVRNFGDGKTLEGRPGRRTPADEVFLMLEITDAARLVAACLASGVKGYRCYFPACATTFLYGLSSAEIRARFYPEVPWRQGVPEDAPLCDTSEIESDVGWSPAPFPTAEPAP